MGDDAGENDAVQQQQFSMSLTACGILKPDPAINARLCAFAGVQIAAYNGPSESLLFEGVGSGPVNKSGGTVAQCVRVEWSPNGLGHHARPVLTALTTSGAIIALGEVAVRTSTGFLSAKTRTFKNWKILWGLGANLPIPDGDNSDGCRAMDEHIVSSAWSREIASGRGLLAHLNDAGEVAVACVQYYSRPVGDDHGQDEEGWEIFEVGRFDGRGCHAVSTTLLKTRCLIHVAG